MSETNNAHYFYKAYKLLSARAKEAHGDLKIARDIGKVAQKPVVPDFPSKKDIIRAEAQLEVYQAIQQKIRFYRERYRSLNEAAENYLGVWLDLAGVEDDSLD